MFWKHTRHCFILQKLRQHCWQPQTCRGWTTYLQIFEGSFCPPTTPNYAVAYLRIGTPERNMQYTVTLQASFSWTQKKHRITITTKVTRCLESLQINSEMLRTEQDPGWPEQEAGLYRNMPYAWETYLAMFYFSKAETALLIRLNFCLEFPKYSQPSCCELLSSKIEQSEELWT